MSPGLYGDLDRPPLSARVLGAALVRPELPWREVQVLGEVASTNAVAGAAGRDGAGAGLVVVAEHQTGGRGRLGRTWVSAPRAGLTVSVLLRPEVDTAEWGWLPLLTGAAVVRALRARAGVAATVKWPNDVLAGDAPAKLAGILAEVPVAGAVVVGLGLNVTTRADELPAGGTSLALLGAGSTDRATVLVAVLRELGAAYDRWHVDPAAVRADYRAACSTLGRRVRLELPDGGAVEGVAEAVDDTGRLVVDGAAHAAGDVVHLRPVT